MQRVHWISSSRRWVTIGDVRFILFSESLAHWDSWIIRALNRIIIPAFSELHAVNHDSLSGESVLDFIFQEFIYLSAIFTIETICQFAHALICKYCSSHWLPPSNWMHVAWIDFEKYRQENQLSCLSELWTWKFVLSATCCSKGGKDEKEKLCKRRADTKANTRVSFVVRYLWKYFLSPLIL